MFQPAYILAKKHAGQRLQLTCVLTNFHFDNLGGNRIQSHYQTSRLQLARVCSRHNLHVRRLTSVQTSRAKSNLLCFLSHGRIVVHSYFFNGCWKAGKLLSGKKAVVGCMKLYSNKILKTSVGQQLNMTVKYQFYIMRISFNICCSITLVYPVPSLWLHHNKLPTIIPPPSKKKRCHPSRFQDRARNSDMDVGYNVTTRVAQSWSTEKASY